MRKPCISASLMAITLHAVVRHYEGEPDRTTLDCSSDGDEAACRALRRYDESASSREAESLGLPNRKGRYSFGFS